jgi:hypothetical protein
VIVSWEYYLRFRLPFSVRIQIPFFTGTFFCMLVLVLVLLHPMAQVGPLRMCLAPDVVPPLAGFLFLAVLGVVHHVLSVVSVRIFETAHCSTCRKTSGIYSSGRLGAILGAKHGFGHKVTL